MLFDVLFLEGEFFKMLLMFIKFNAKFVISPFIIYLYEKFQISTRIMLFFNF